MPEDYLPKGVSGVLEVKTYTMGFWLFLDLSKSIMEMATAFRLHLLSFLKTITSGIHCALEIAMLMKARRNEEDQGKTSPQRVSPDTLAAFREASVQQKNAPRLAWGKGRQRLT